MPKNRKAITPEEETIINGGAPPAASATVKPVPEVPRGETVERPQVIAAPKGAVRPTMVRMSLEEFTEIEKVVEESKKTMRVSMNSWIVAACREKLDRDRK